MGDFPKLGHICDCNRFLLGEYYSCPQCPVKQLTSVEETTVLKSKLQLSLIQAATHVPGEVSSVP